jgi:hypothetical protein
MATVTFDVPDDLKVAFDQTFSDQDQSAVVAELMREAVARSIRSKQRDETSVDATRRRAHDRSLANQARVARLRRSL